MAEKGHFSKNEENWIELKQICPEDKHKSLPICIEDLKDKIRITLDAPFDIILYENGTWALD